MSSPTAILRLGYRERTGSSLPTKERQHPNEHLEKIRFRINARGTSRFKNTSTKGGAMLDTGVSLGGASKPPPRAIDSTPESTEKVRSSVVDFWRRRIKNMLGFGKTSQVRQIEQEGIVKMRVETV